MSSADSPRFVHLHLHTEYSLVDGLLRISQLVNAVAEQGMPAVAVTDQSNLFAMVKFYRAAVARGVKPIIGVDVRIRDEAANGPASRLVLLVQNEDGYASISRLISRAWLEGQHRGVPMLERAWLQADARGLIALSGAREGDVGQALLAGKPDQARRYAEFWRECFADNFYLELVRSGRENEASYLHAAVELAIQDSLPVVATNDVCFATQEDYEAHEARVCIHDGRTLDDSRRPRLYSDQQYLRSPQEMAELFADLPEALENSVEIARRCNLELTLGTNVLPDFPVPEGMTTEEYLVQQSRDGLERRLSVLLDSTASDDAERRQPYDERLQLELDVITQMGFPGYFLIVADFIRWARENGIPVGPGRGSGAGSLVAWVLQITDLDPIEHELLFERFLNPERVSMPDFDVDFCMEGRDRVIDYVAGRYGRDRVSQIITYGSMKARAVVRDVGRVLGHPYGFIDKLAKLIPFDLKMTLDKALDEEEDLRQRYENEEDVRALFDLARSLEGIARNAGKHAGGVVIAPSPLTDFTPLYCEEGGSGVATQLDKDDVEAIGLVKFDFLGLRTLTIIDWAVKTINRQRQAGDEGMLRIEQLPMDDPVAFDLLKRSATTAVFQLESRGMKDLIKRLQPDCFDDIVALVALFRPGPLQSGMVDDFIDRKHGRARVNYPHPELELILQPTYGVILYQEQVMQIAQVLAGYTLGGADLLRRAMGKKKAEEMAKQREIFVSGAVARNVEEKTATYIFDLMEKFAGYGFNKSHSAAYALVSYQTAWLKAHYPAAFMAAVLSADMDNTDKIVTLIDECRDMQMKVRPPDVNRSAFAFTVTDDNTIVYGLGAIKGVGRAAIDSILAEHATSGQFSDLFDFCKRIDLRKANRRVLEALIRAGALDGLGPNRATLMAQLPDALQVADQHTHMADTGQSDLFGLAEIEAPAVADGQPGAQWVEDWDEDQRLLGERETLGLYLTGHPINRYRPELARFTTCSIDELSQHVSTTGGSGNSGGGRRDEGRPVVVGGLAIAQRTMQSQRGNRMAFITLDDRSGRVEVAVFGETYQRYRDILGKDRVLVVQGSLTMDEYSGGYRVAADHIMEIDQAREVYARGLIVRWEGTEDHPAWAADGNFINALQDSLAPFREGNCPVFVDYYRTDARARLPLGKDWAVHPTDQLLQRLRKLAGNESVRVEY